MKNKVLLDALADINPEFIEEALRFEEDAREKSKKRAKMLPARIVALAACLAIIVCAYPVYNLLKPKEEKTVIVTYQTLAEMEAALGFETLFSKPELGIMGMSVLYEKKDGELANVENPIQIVATARINVDSGIGVAVYNMFFKINDIEKCSFKEYGRLNAEYELSGTKVYKGTADRNGILFDIAAVSIEGIIYTVEAPTSGQGTLIDTFVKRLVV